MDEKSVRDKVITESAASYQKITTPENILTNKEGDKKHDIQGEYPDVIVRTKTGEMIIEKIETESTIKKEKADQWRRLASLGHEFKLVVPLSKIEDAKLLSTGIQNINVQAYDLVGDQIHWFGQR
ncbi:hypothetical protein HY382_01085 [Candidatus Curtissbacteria bacterium]|nr:hypothetical protein [Candidatus Curtissbacteria bacterium]